MKPKECWKTKLERALSFRFQSGKITVWPLMSITNCYRSAMDGSCFPATNA